MAKDSRLYAKFDIGMDEHPKIMLLSDAAFRALFESTLYARRQLTDGFLDERVVMRKWGAEVATELSSNNPERPSWVRVDGGWMIHDFGEHQTTTLDIEAKREAGRKGGLAKAKQTSSTSLAGATEVLQQNPSNCLAKTETETETTTPNGVVPRTRASRIPEGFAPTPDMLIWAAGRAPHVDIGLSTEKFINYWTSKTTAATKLDWAATWRNWILSDQERATKQPQQFLTAAERKLQHGAELMQHFQNIENQQNQIGA
jgi:hypothetical protein